MSIINFIFLFIDWLIVWLSNDIRIEIQLQRNMCIVNCCCCCCLCLCYWCLSAQHLISTLIIKIICFVDLIHIFFIVTVCIFSPFLSWPLDGLFSIRFLGENQRIKFGKHTLFLLILKFFLLPFTSGVCFVRWSVWNYLMNFFHSIVTIEYWRKNGWQFWTTPTSFNIKSVLLVLIKCHCFFSFIHFVSRIAGNIIPDIIPVPPIRPEDLPQNIGTNNLLACLVCGSMIDITIKKDQHVVKCDNCNEATVSLSTL